jgi:GT2 family glycosyltransferase
MHPFSVAQGYDAARILIRTKGTPLGWIELPCKERQECYAPQEILTIVAERLEKEIMNEACCDEFLPEPDCDFSPAAISVIICTRDRPKDLDTCLHRLGLLDYSNFEVVVVDNASKDAQTREVVRRHGFRYVREARPGLDWARNRGIAEAANSLLAFINDDARADSKWLKAINGAFGDPDVMGVTGLVVPQELETEAQIYFEQVYGGMGMGFRRQSFQRGSVSDRRLLWASSFGVGANMAFRRCVFEAVGLFDPALDAGTATRGGGDVEFLHRLVAKGQLLLYEPKAIVWHVHRREFSALRQQLGSNGCSVIPYILTCLRNQTISRKAALDFFCFEILGWWILHRLFRPGKHQRALVWAEAWGLVLGLLVYRKALAEAARLAGTCLAEESEASSTKHDQQAAVRPVDCRRQTQIRGHYAAAEENPGDGGTSDDN